ncbi:hypothetical protein [Bacillus sp. SG-1]|nr:hypothetical protein [Bacillus sp. SG-1]EDL66467.1 hypothetical protein BSG1_03905 [Bacillus sp. SG-1]
MNFFKVILFVIMGILLAIGLLSYFGNMEIVQLIINGAILGLLLYIAIKQ